jgi:hypothetical protein
LVGVVAAGEAGVAGFDIAGAGVAVDVAGAGVVAAGVVGAICASAGALHSATPAITATMRARLRRAGRMMSRLGAAVVMALSDQIIPRE